MIQFLTPTPFVSEEDGAPARLWLGQTSEGGLVFLWALAVGCVTQQAATEFSADLDKEIDAYNGPDLVCGGVQMFCAENLAFATSPHISIESRGRKDGE